jgi:hypothetical protein
MPTGHLLLYTLEFLRSGLCRTTPNIPHPVRGGVYSIRSISGVGTHSVFFYFDIIEGGFIGNVVKSLFLDIPVKWKEYCCGTGAEKPLR